MSTVKKRCKCCCLCRLCFDSDGGYYKKWSVTVAGMPQTTVCGSGPNVTLPAPSLSGTWEFEIGKIIKVDASGSPIETLDMGGCTSTIVIVGDILTPQRFIALTLNDPLGIPIFYQTEAAVFQPAASYFKGSPTDCKSTHTLNILVAGIINCFGTTATATITPVAGSWVPCGLNESGGEIETTVLEPLSVQSTEAGEAAARIPLRTVRCLYLGRRIETSGCCDGGRRHECDHGRPAVPGEYCQTCPEYVPDGDAGW